MSLLELAGLKLPEALPIPESEAQILAALDGTGYLLLPYNGLPLILAVSTNKISAGACERITETRLEVMQKSLREAGFKPGESVDLSELAQLQAEALQDKPVEPTTPKLTQRETEPKPENEDDFDDHDDVKEGDSDPYADEEDDPDDEADDVPFQTEAEKQEKLRAVAKSMKGHSKLILEAEIDAIYPAILAWGIAGRGWGVPGKGDKPTREELAGDTFLGRGLRSVLLDGFLRPIMRGLPTQAAFRPEDLFPKAKAPKESPSNQ